MVGPINPFAGLGAVNSGGNRNQIQDERENLQVQSEIESKAGADGEMTESQETSDRDADGRQLLFRQQKDSADFLQEESEEEQEGTIPFPSQSQSQDPNRGNRLDLTG